MMEDNRICLPWPTFSLNNGTTEGEGNVRSLQVADGTNDSVLLNSTMAVYGSIFVVSFLIFCFVRKRIPRVFVVRTWCEGKIHDCALAQQCLEYGYFDWIYKVLQPSEDEIRDQCGMDSICYLRTMVFGMKLAAVGIFNSIWLLPVYYTAADSAETAEVTDRVAALTIAHVPPGTLRMLAPVISSYVVFGFTMMFILQEFEWFRRHRHAFLSERVPRNYVAYATGLPRNLRSNRHLCKFFGKFSPATIRAHVALFVPKLDKKVQKRFKLSRKLEHMINLARNKNGGELSTTNGSEEQNKIHAAAVELGALNKDIHVDVEELEQLLKQAEEETERALGPPDGWEPNELPQANSSANMVVDVAKDDPAEATELGEVEVTKTVSEDEPDPKKLSSLTKIVKRGVDTTVGTVQQTLTTGVRDVTSSGRVAAKTALSKLRGKEEGTPREAGFVFFKTLVDKNIAIQVIHHQTPYTVDVFAAPDPDRMFWRNVGKTAKELQVGGLISLIVTFGLRILWTIPVAFAASLANIEELTTYIPQVEEWADKYPGLPTFFAILSPLVLIILNSSLPTILEWIVLFELPIDHAAQINGIFPKLSSFMIIQTFFVSALSGSFLSQLEDIVDSGSVTKIFDILATSLPGQSTYFIQILLVKTFIGLLMENLRVLPLCKAFGRKFIGPRASAEERGRRVLGFLRPLNEPLWLLHAETLAANVLYFMVFFVYSSTAPLVNWFLMFCFLLLYPCWKYAIFANYPTKPDTGGRMWIMFMGIVRVSTIIGQLTLWAILALKDIPYAIPLMLPLLSINILFNIYMEQRHKRIAEFLPSADAIAIDDVQNNKNNDAENYAFLENHYLQPALTAKDPVWPDNLPESLRVE